MTTQYPYALSVNDPFLNEQINDLITIISHDGPSSEGAHAATTLMHTLFEWATILHTMSEGLELPEHTWNQDEYLRQWPQLWKALYQSHIIWDQLHENGPFPWTALLALTYATHPAEMGSNAFPMLAMDSTVEDNGLWILHSLLHEHWDLNLLGDKNKQHHFIKTLHGPMPSHGLPVVYQWMNQHALGFAYLESLSPWSILELSLQVLKKARPQSSQDLKTLVDYKLSTYNESSESIHGKLWSHAQAAWPTLTQLITNYTDTYEHLELSTRLVEEKSIYLSQEIYRRYLQDEPVIDNDVFNSILSH